jgi:hypothetical protein
METRSQSKTKYNNSLYNIDIDFDEASEAWRQNKKHIGQGHFKYTCTGFKKDGSKCISTCYKDSIYCWSHRGTIKKDNI